MKMALPASERKSERGHDVNTQPAICQQRQQGKPH
jgi:hypothetical protein